MKTGYREVKFPYNLVNVRVQANSSYQLKRVLEAIENEKGFTLMSKSEIQTNRTAGPKLRQFVTFRDEKSEKRNWQKRKNYYNHYNDTKQNTTTD